MNHAMSRFSTAIVLAGLALTSANAEEANLSALTYSPWIKLCLKETCFVERDGRSEPDCGPVVSAVLIERLGNSKKTLHVTLPAWVNAERGVRIVIDQGEPIERPYVGCVAFGCRAEYEGGAELVDRFKRGRSLRLEAVDKANSPITVTVPLIGFADAYEGAPQEQKVFETTAKKAQELIEGRKSRCETGQSQ